jgi:hypothetical protein
VTAIQEAIDGLDMDSGVDEGVSAETKAAIVDAIIPDIALLSPRSGLEKIIDLMILAREEIEDDLLVVTVTQASNIVVVGFYDLTDAQVAEIVTDTETADDHIAAFTMKMPESAVNTPAVVKLPLE